MNRRGFDCVNMMHQGSAQVQSELKGKFLEEQMEYWRNSTAALLQRQARLRGNKHQAAQEP